MEIPFVLPYCNYSTLLQEVAFDAGTADGVVSAEVESHVLSEAAGVFIADCFAVSEGLQDGVAGQYLVFYGVVSMLAEAGQYFHAIFSGFRLSSA